MRAFDRGLDWRRKTKSSIVLSELRLDLLLTFSFSLDLSMASQKTCTCSLPSGFRLMGHLVPEGLAPTFSCRSGDGTELSSLMQPTKLPADAELILRISKSWAPGWANYTVKEYQ